MEIPFGKNSHHTKTSTAMQINWPVPLRVFTERYLQTEINLNYDLPSLIFLKFKSNWSQGASVAGSKGVNFIPKEFQK